MENQLYLGLFNITNAAITPGIHPAKVNKNTIKIEPQPLSKIDNGGNTIAKITRQILILNFLILQIYNKNLVKAFFKTITILK